MKRVLSQSSTALCQAAAAVLPQNLLCTPNNYICYKKYAHTVNLADKKFSWLVQSPPSVPSSTVVWFKNDLRCFDNPALYFAAKYSAELEQKSLIGLFVFCLKEWRVHGYSDAKICLMRSALQSLKERLVEKYSIPLLIVVEDEPADVPLAIERFCIDTKCKGFFYNKQYEADEAERDRIVESRLRANHNISVWSFDDQCVVPPGVCKTQQGNDYAVFTPFKKRWIAELESEPQKYLRLYNLDTLALNNVACKISIEPAICLETAFADVNSNVFDAHWSFNDEDAICEQAQTFISTKAAQYHKTRDFPFINDGTSRLSPYLALGVISPKFLITKCKEQNNKKLASGSEGIVTWISEICWRDFYRNILVAFPRVSKNKPFKAETERIPWSTDTDAFNQWCKGMTGFPIVDAGMRQLVSTGWMHNRLRMVTAMFLTKDLLINWQWGESFFMRNLIDGDFASNNGGWQWSASTGTDSQPYFRVFNPVLQSEKFDPNGDFISKWVPELASLAGTSAIHDPFGRLSKAQFQKLNYPTPIVDHSVARLKVIEVFKKALSR